MDEDTPDMTFDDADPLDGDMSDEPTVAREWSSELKGSPEAEMIVDRHSTASKTRPLSSSQPLKSNKPPAKTNKPAGMPIKPSSKPIKPVVRTHSRTASDSKAKSATRDAEEADDFDDMEMDVDGDEKEVAAVRARNDKDVVGKKVAHAGEDQGQENVGASEELVRKVAELERQLSAVSLKDLIAANVNADEVSLMTCRASPASDGRKRSATALPNSLKSYRRSKRTRAKRPLQSIRRRRKSEPRVGNWE